MDFSDYRPNSVLARGVQITEFGDSQVNPEPVPLDESDLLLHQYLSPRKLCLLGGADDLEDINSLELKVDTSEMSLGNFGSLVPNLTELKLSNSTIHSIRDLGSCLHGLKILWMSQCSLQDLDGIGSLSNVQELYLSFNEISEISSVSMLENLEILDLEGNKIDCLSQIQYLAFCTKLTVLTLEGNPVCVKPSPETEIEDYNYRLFVRDAIPQLENLDDEPLSNENCKKNVNVFDDDWAYMEKLQQDVSLQEALLTNNNEEETGKEESQIGSQSFISAFRPATSFKPGSALRPSSAMRPVTCRTRPQTSTAKKEPLRPFSALAAVETEDVSHVPDSISELTDGSVVCGNPSRALLSRNKHKTAPSGNQRRLFPQYSFAPEHTFDPFPDANENLTDVLDQLQHWKIQHEKRRKQIEASWAPQVLKIEPGDYVEESDEERGLDDNDDDDDNDTFSWETRQTLLDTKIHSFEKKTLNRETIAYKSKKQFHNYDHDELVYPVSPSKMDEADDDGMNSEPLVFVKPSPPSRPPLSPPFACRSKMLKSQARKVLSLKPDQSVCSSMVMSIKQPIIKEQISPSSSFSSSTSLNGKRPFADTKAFPRSFSARAAMSIPHPPSLLPSLPNLKTKSSPQKTP